MPIGRNIVFFRKRMGLTQSELSRRMEVTPQAVSKWEREINCPDIALLPLLAAILGVTVDDLLADRLPKQ